VYDIASAGVKESCCTANTGVYRIEQIEDKVNQEQALRTKLIINQTSGKADFFPVV
jgi:hypothetical protein